MATWAMPLKSVNGSNMYGVQDFAQFFSNYFSNGIIANVGLDGQTAFQVTQDTTPSLNLLVGSGVAQMGTFGQLMSTDVRTFTIDPPLTTQARTDSIVLQFNISSNSADIYYRSNSTQVTRNDTIWENQLATITVPANASSITNANITDMRANPDVCGYCSPYTKINAGDITAQFSAQFNTFLTSVQNQLGSILQNKTYGLIASNTDLNTMRVAGFYASEGSTGITNYPSGATGTWFELLVISAGSNNSAQIYIETNTNKAWYRVSHTNGTLQFFDWILIPNDKTVVHNTGDETIAGTKTFSGKAIFNGGIAAKTVSLTSATDLNTLTVGEYSADTDAIATSCLNLPSGVTQAFKVSVTGNGSSTVQQLTVYATGDQFTRTQAGGG